MSSYLPPRVLESAHSGFAIAFNTKYLINGFGNLLALNHASWCVYRFSTIQTLLIVNSIFREFVVCAVKLIKALLTIP